VREGGHTEENHDNETISYSSNSPDSVIAYRIGLPTRMAAVPAAFVQSAGLRLGDRQMKQEDTAAGRDVDYSLLGRTK
jgi:hypothetical protein